MGVLLKCSICGEDKARENELIDEEYICEECQIKAIRIGVKILKNEF